jgi:hypothetical protein
MGQKSITDDDLKGPIWEWERENVSDLEGTTMLVDKSLNPRVALFRAAKNR